MRESAAVQSQLRTSSARMEAELQGYKKKVENMTVLVKHYQSELESQKVRRDGVETVSRLLAESRQENVALKKNLVALETTVKNLQNRLVVCGVSSSEGGDDNEVIVPGTSKQTLTNLVIENKRLRSMLQRDSGSENNENDSLQKPDEDTDKEQAKQQIIDKLTAENKSMKMKLSDLETLFKSSNNEKDRQLVQLQDEVHHLQQQAVKGSSVGGTAPALPMMKEQLRAFMSQCQLFEKQLDNLPEVEIVREETGVELTPVTKQPCEGPDSLDGVDVKQLLEDRQKLQDRVEEVTKMNQRWQEFYKDRDRYTQSLEQRVQELDERLKEAMRSGPTQEINRRIEQVLEKSHKELEQVEEMRRKAEEEAEQLRQDVCARDTHIGQLQSQVTILSRSPVHPSSAETNSTIEHLKAQIQVCTEDFEKERQDRQVALQKVASLKEQNAQLQTQNTYLQSLMCSQPRSQPRPAAQEHGHHDPSQQPHTLQPRGARYLPGPTHYDTPRPPLHTSSQWRDYPDFDYEYEAPHMDSAHLAGPTSFHGMGTELIARGPQPKQPQAEAEAGREETKQNVLTCPKCNTEFSEEHQGELLAHMDVCWE